MKSKVFICLLLSSVAFVPSSLFAQAAEINPYAAYHFTGDNDQVGGFHNGQLFGVRGGVYLGKSFELGGNYAWKNHFQPDSGNNPARLAGALGFPQGSGRAHIWEAELTYNFGSTNMLGSFVRPYIVGGFGGLTTKVKDPDTFVLNVNEFDTVAGPVFVANDIMESGDTFFTFSYGGGVKAHRLWGPMGIFGDVRGRAIPNFFGHGTNAFEVGVGLVFSWGER
jgi:hypothetical protein